MPRRMPNARVPLKIYVAFTVRYRMAYATAERKITTIEMKYDCAFSRRVTYKSVGNVSMPV